MKKDLKGGIIAVLLVVIAVLLFYIIALRAGSGERLGEFDRTVALLEARLDALEAQGERIGKSAGAIENELLSISRGVRQIDSDIEGMRAQLKGSREYQSVPLFQWGFFRITFLNGLVILFLLAVIWLLVRFSRRVSVPEKTGPEPRVAAGPPPEEKKPPEPERGPPETVEEPVVMREEKPSEPVEEPVVTAEEKPVEPVEEKEPVATTDEVPKKRGQKRGQASKRE